MEDFYYPHYSQGDPKWSKQVMGRNKTIKQAGCAITCCAMAIEGDSGNTTTPLMVDQYLDSVKGYYGDSVIWSKLIGLAKSKGVVYKDFQKALPKRFEPDENHTIIARVHSTTHVQHYVLLLPNGKIHDPASRSGANNTLEQHKYIVEELNVFIKEEKQ